MAREKETKQAGNQTRQPRNAVRRKIGSLVHSLPGQPVLTPSTIVLWELHRRKMEESSSSAEHRKWILLERRRLHELILTTRLDLEQEKLRARRLKRKSLREQWLMEGTSASSDDQDPLSPLHEAETRIEGLQHSLTGLQMQVQHLDDVEIDRKSLQESLPEKSIRDLDEGSQSLGGLEEVDGNTLSSSEGRSKGSCIPELAPVSPKRPLSADAKEALQNGEAQDGDLSGSECSPEEAKVKVIPVATEKGVHKSHRGVSETTSAANPMNQSLDTSRAPASHQRKLAMEEMVIRDHLGQEVGCMDAVGQNQNTFEKEEELEEHTNLEDRSESWNQPKSVDSVSDPKKVLDEGPLDHELGSRDGPEGQSPTSQDSWSPSRLVKDENNYPKWQGDGVLEMDSLAKEAGGKGERQKVVSEVGAREMQPALAPDDVPTAESVKQKQGGQTKMLEWLVLGTTEEGQGNKTPGSQLEQLTASLPHQFPPIQETKALSSHEETKVSLLDPALPSSPTQVLVIPQDKVPSLQGTKGSPLDQIPSSLQENEGSLLEPQVSFLSNQSALPPFDQNSSLQESKGPLLGWIPSSLQECLSDQCLPSQQDHLSSSLEIKPSPLQGEVTYLQDTKPSVLDQIPPSLHEADGKFSLWSQTQTPSLLDQAIPPLPEVGPLMLEHTSSCCHEIKKSITPQGQELFRHVKGSLQDSIPSLTNQPSSLPDQMPALEVSSVVPQGQMPPEAHGPPLPETDVFLPSPVPPSVDEALLPCENSTSLHAQIPQTLQDMRSMSLEGKAPTSCLQEVDRALPDEIQTILRSHTLPYLPEAEGSSPEQAPSTLKDQKTTTLPGQASSFQEAAKSLPEGQKNSSDPSTEVEPTPTPNKAPSPLLQDTSSCPNALPFSSQEALQPLLDKTEAEKNGKEKESGNASMASAGARAITDALGNLHAEQQPLLKETKASGAPPDISIGDPQSKAGILKPQGTTCQPAPTYSITSANTASLHQLPVALPLQGEDQEPEKGKHKSCQCCILM